MHSNNLDLWSEFWAYYPRERDTLASLQDSLEYGFNDIKLLYQALAHRSAVVDFMQRRSKKGSLPWNERIEFLGDAVLELVMSSKLWDKGENFSEGKLSRLRASMVNESVLAELARGISLGESIPLGRGEMQMDGKNRDALLADGLEAVFGAIYLDGGFEEAFKVIEKLFEDLLKRDLLSLDMDYKTQLQELMQARYKLTPFYEMLESEGPEHKKIFTVEVKLEDRILATGSGANLKKASQNAAMQALKLKDEL